MALSARVAGHHSSGPQFRGGTFRATSQLFGKLLHASTKPANKANICDISIANKFVSNRLPLFFFSLILLLLVRHSPSAVVVRVCLCLCMCLFDNLASILTDLFFRFFFFYQKFA